MKIQLESMDELVVLSENGHTMQARIWTGTTEDGIGVIAYITRIGFAEREIPEDFNPGLIECRTPVPVATKKGQKIII